MVHIMKIDEHNGEYNNTENTIKKTITTNYTMGAKTTINDAYIGGIESFDKNIDDVDEYYDEIIMDADEFSFCIEGVCTLSLNKNDEVLYDYNNENTIKFNIEGRFYKFSRHQYKYNVEIETSLQSDYFEIFSSEEITDFIISNIRKHNTDITEKMLKSIGNPPAKSSEYSFYDFADDLVLDSYDDMKNAIDEDW